MALLKRSAGGGSVRATVPSLLRSSHISRVSTWLILLSPLLLGSSDSRSENSRIEISREAQLKAVFLFNFAQFTDWPKEAFEDRTSPLVIGIFGNDPFGDFLDETVKNELVHGRRIRVERYRTLAQVKNWHIMYIGFADPERVEQVLKSIKGKPVLTVSDIENSSRRSGIVIKFLTKQNKIRFTINAEAAREARLVLSSKLLHAADEVIGADRK
jgi:hypothetical protein